MNILLIVAGITSIILGLSLVALGIFIACALYQLEKFEFQLPWLKWLTLKQISEMGFSRTWARAILPIFHEHGQLEVRLGGGEVPMKVDQMFIDELGFTPRTLEFYEFRLTKRGGRKKSKIKLKELLPAWNPLPA